MPKRTVIRTLCALALTALAAPALSAELVHADGRRETVEDLRRMSDGRFTCSRDGRRVFVPEGEVAFVVDDGGKETETIPDLLDRDPTPEELAALESVRDERNEEWAVAAAVLAKHPTRKALDELRRLTEDRSRSVRTRGVRLLAALRTRESVLAAAKAVVAEKDLRTRRECASALFSAREILLRTECGEILATGLGDEDTDVRVDFGLLAARRGDEKALEVLRKDGIGHSDHHFRESAAVALARAGDPAGERILFGMLSRKRVPGFSRDDEELMLRTLIREQTEICALLGRLGSEEGRKAVEKALRSPHEEVRKAAEAALADWPAPEEKED